MEGKIPNNYDEVNQKIISVIQDLTKLKDELMNNLENELTAIYSIVSTFGFFYYAIGIILLVVDTSFLWI